MVALCRIFRSGFMGLLVLACLGSIVAFGAGWSQWLDLASHFRWLYLWVEVSGVLVCLISRRYAWSIGFFLCLLMNATQFVPFYKASDTLKATPYRALRVLQLNTWASNRHPQRIADLLAATQPDLAALEEITADNASYLRQQPIVRTYSTVVWFPTDRLMLLSRYSLAGKPVFGSHPPMIQAIVHREGHPISIIVAHTYRPIGDYPEYLRQMQRLSQAIYKMPRPIVLMGDLNTGPWSFPFKRLIQQTGLQNTQRGQGLQPTYPYIFPKTQLLTYLPILPIDHVLVSRELVTLKRWNGPFSGSDHLPVLVDFGWAR